MRSARLLPSRSRLGGLMIACSLGGAGLAATSAAPASANLLNLDRCNANTLSQPFAPWGDPSSYELAPGGDFESGLTGWSVTGGAAIVPGSEPYGVTGSVGQSSLSLPSGSTATAPATCVTADYPTIRFFAQTPGLSTVAVSLVYQTWLGPIVLPAGVATLNGAWSPTLPMTTLSAIPGLLSGGTAQVSLSFTELTGTAQIDDVFIDPGNRW